MLMDVALDEDRCDIRVQTHRKENRSEFEGLDADGSRHIRDGESVQVHDPMEDIFFVLSRDPVDEGTQMVAQVDRAGGLDT